MLHLVIGSKISRQLTTSGKRSNLEKYVQFDKKKWRYSDQDKDGLLNRQEYEYFHHPEVMLTYVAVISTCGTFSNEQLKSCEMRLRFNNNIRFLETHIKTLCVNNKIKCYE